MKLISLTILFITSAFCNAQWNTMNVGSSTDLFSVNMIDVDTAFASDQTGKVFKTVDGGQTWTNPSPNSGGTKCEFVNSNLGLAFGGTNLYQTTDGGQNWTQKITGFFDVWNATFSSPNIAYAVGSNSTFDSLLVWKSIDAGNSWTNTGALLSYGGFGEICHFVDDNIGFVGVDLGLLYKTTNGGQSWDTLGDFSTTMSSFVGIDFISATQGIITSDMGTCYRTMDGGTTWDTIQTGFTGIMHDVKYITQNVVLITGGTGFGAGFILKSYDAGATWQQDFTTSAAGIELDAIGTTALVVGQSNSGYYGPVDTTESSGVGFTDMNLDHFKLYPNPAVNQVTLQFSSIQTDATVSIFDKTGKLILRENHASTTVQLDLNELCSGMYFVELRTPSSFSSQTLIVVD